MVSLLAHREVFNSSGYPQSANLVNEDELVDRLINTYTLVGHSGCVNSLRWNTGGTLLASGSDDHYLIVWSEMTNVLSRIATGHIGNVFAVDFLPAGRDHTLLSAAADQMVMMHDIEDGQQYVWQAEGRIKRLCTAQDDPFLFWSASEDGVIREFDTRTNEVRNILKMPRRKSVKSMAICQSQTNMIAIATTHPEVPIYDRRKIDHDPMITLCDRFGSNGIYTTHVAFNANGTECVVNQGAGAVCVFDITKNGEPQVMENIEEILKNSEPVEPIATLPFDSARKKGFEYVQERKFSEAIDLYSEEIYKKHQEVDRSLESILYSNRSMSYLCRRWRGDSYASIRDSVKALQAHPGNSKALWRLTKALMALEKWELARRCVQLFTSRFPHDGSIRRIEKELEEMPGEDKGVRSKPPSKYRDYIERYMGQTNFQTDIKESNFFGSKEQYIVAGSDCGSLMMWNRAKGTLVGAWKADENILNIVQPHPQSLLLATSGIDEEIRIWGPGPEYYDEKRRIPDTWQFLRDQHAAGSRRLQLSMMAFPLLDNFENAPECVNT